MIPIEFFFNEILINEFNYYDSLRIKHETFWKKKIMILKEPGVNLELRLVVVVSRSFYILNR